MGPVSTKARALLFAVADILPMGTATIAFGTLFFKGHEALFVNGSNLVIGPVRDGETVVEKAQNVPSGRAAADIAADIIKRFAGRKAA